MLPDRIIAALFAVALAFFPLIAFAQSSPIPGFPTGLFDNRAARDPATGGTGINYTFQAAPTPIAGTANPTSFSSVSIGTAASNRIVIVCVVQAANGPTTAVAVNPGSPVSLTLAGQSDAGATTASVWYGTVTSGTTATIAVTTTNPFAVAVGISVATINSSSSPGTAQGEPFNFNVDPQTTAAITVPTGGVGVGCGIAAPPGTPNVGTWMLDSSASLGTTIQDVLFHTSSTGSQAPSVTGYSFTGYGQVAVPFGP